MKLQIAGLLLASAAATLAGPAVGIPDGWSDAYVYANGIRIHYYRAVPAPGKPAIVMVHGVTDNGLCWTTLTRDLEKSYDIYMVDARAHGLSDPLKDTDTGDTLVEDVVGFVNAMKLEKPILMGHSMGAATVMRVGAQHPELARAVIMLDPGLGRRPPGAAPPSAPKPPGGTKGKTSAAPANPRAGSLTMFGTPEALVAQNNYSFDDLVARCGRQTPKWDPVDCQYWALSKKQYHGAYSTAQGQAMSGTMRTAEALSRIMVPALILKADASADVRKVNEEAAAVMQKGKLLHIDGAGHNLHHDQRKRTVDVLTEFLGSL